MKAAGVGALLLFETSNIRYTTWTNIGYRAFNKAERWAVVTPSGQPEVWDFGSAVRAHRPQLPSLHDEENSVAGNTGLQGAIGPKTERVGCSPWRKTSSSYEPAAAVIGIGFDHEKGDIRVQHCVN